MQSMLYNWKQMGDKTFVQEQNYSLQMECVMKFKIEVLLKFIQDVSHERVIKNHFFKDTARRPASLWKVHCPKRPSLP